MISKSILEEALADEFSDALRTAGFKLHKPGKWRSQDRMREMRIVWDSKMQDPLRGRSFTLEFENAKKPGIFEKGLTGRVRLNRLLDDEQREAVTKLRNEVVSRFPQPDEATLNSVPEFLRDQYLSYFQPIKSLGPRDWLSFIDKESAMQWASLLSGMCGHLIEKSSSVDPNELGY